jgi:hypothetical protein
MSVVCTEVFKHVNARNVENVLKSYALDDKFYFRMEEFSVMGGVNRTGIELSVAEAKIVKKQLEEFIAQNT